MEQKHKGMERNEEKSWYSVSNDQGGTKMRQVADQGGAA